MKKVLLILPNLAGGGAEKVMLTLLENLDRKKATYYFLVVNKEGPYVNDLPEDINIIDLGIKGKFFFRKKMFKVQKNLILEINRIKPDVILTTLTEMNITILSIRNYLKNSPKIVVRETNPPSPRWKSWKKKIMKYLYSIFYSKADEIIAISKGVKNDLITFSKIPERKVKVIYNPLPIRDIQYKSTKECKIINDQDKAFNIISIGRLTEQKDYPTLLKAFKIVSEYYNVNLYILGEGNEYHNLIELRKELRLQDKVHFLGFQENPYAFLKNSNLFILSSKWEGFGLVIVEALATGTPVIATNADGAPEEILEGGKYGILTRVGDVESMADYIVKFINKNIVFDENSLINRSFEFDVNVISDKYLKLLLC